MEDPTTSFGLGRYFLFLHVFEKQSCVLPLKVIFWITKQTDFWGAQIRKNHHSSGVPSSFSDVEFIPIGVSKE